MNYRDLYDRLTAATRDGREAQAMARMIAEVGFHLGWADVLCGGLEQLSASDAARLEQVVSRVEQGWPVQYALGLAEFGGRLFEVAPGVLIPRPETAELCRWIVEEHLSGSEERGAGSVVRGAGSEERGARIDYCLNHRQMSWLARYSRSPLLAPRSSNSAPRTSHLEMRSSNSAPRTSHLEKHSPNTAPRILDICTGSGCIAVTLALDFPGSQVEAWDIAPEALALARRNAHRHGVAVTVSHRDILAQCSPSSPAPPSQSAASASRPSRVSPPQPAASASRPSRVPSPLSAASASRPSRVSPYQGENPAPPFSLIVSNPPYICRRERADMEARVLDHEPALALFVPDDDPLLFYRAIASFALHSLQPGGRIYFELNPLYAEDVAQMLTSAGFTDVMLRKDFLGRARFLRACRPL